ncbi:MAG: glycosyltransferase [Nitrosomonadales bacterium]|nr:glycosyltransferase [Nitrosomonadales bacterium]
MHSHTETEIADAAVMNITPVVSVVMATYNHGHFIAEAIEGVVSQKTDFPVELIIGEDCSTDHTRDIVLDYQKRYPGIIRVVYSDRNLGSFHNSNRLVARVRGEFLAFCEGDDYWSDPLKLQKQVDYLRARPEYGMVHSDHHMLVFSFGAWRLIDARHRTSRKKIPQGDIFADLLHDMPIIICTVMGRASLLKQHYTSEFRKTSYLARDVPLVLHMSKLGKIGYIDEPLSVYRHTPGSMSRTGSLNSIKILENVLDIYRDFIESFGETGIDMLPIWIKNYRAIASFAFRAGVESKFDEAVNWLAANAPEFSGSVKLKMLKALLRYPKVRTTALGILQSIREIDMYRRTLFTRKTI